MKQQDYRALGKYAEAIETIRYADTQRKQLIGSLLRLFNRIAPLALEDGEVGVLDIRTAEDIMVDLAKREAEIDVAIKQANVNAPKCGKPYLKRSGWPPLTAD